MTSSNDTLCYVETVILSVSLVSSFEKHIRRISQISSMESRFLRLTDLLVM